jgi:hypothetical protein
MKTAMQELIEFVKDERFAHSNYTIELKAIELLEKEREQLLNAFRDNSWDKSFNQYYNENYNQNK